MAWRQVVRPPRELSFEDRDAGVLTTADLAACRAGYEGRWREQDRAWALAHRHELGKLHLGDLIADLPGYYVNWLCSQEGMFLYCCQHSVQHNAARRRLLYALVILKRVRVLPHGYVQCLVCPECNDVCRPGGDCGCGCMGEDDEVLTYGTLRGAASGGSGQLLGPSLAAAMLLAPCA
jgi:hypothetical protein